MVFVIEPRTLQYHTLKVIPQKDKFKIFYGYVEIPWSSLAIIVFFVRNSGSTGDRPRFPRKGRHRVSRYHAQYVGGCVSHDIDSPLHSLWQIASGKFWHLEWSQPQTKKQRNQTMHRLCHDREWTFQRQEPQGWGWAWDVMGGTILIVILFG